MNNAWKFICLFVGGIFTSHSTLVLPFLLHVALFPLLFFVHLSRTCFRLPLVIRRIFQALCFTHSWIWLDTQFFILTCCWGHWTTVVVLSSGHGAEVPFPHRGTEVTEEHLTSESGKGLWMQVLPSQEICYFLFGLVTSARCRHWYTPEYQIDWLLGDSPAFQHMEPAPFHLGGNLSFCVDEGIGAKWIGEGLF